MYNKYGFYESIDYTPSRVSKNGKSVVKTYMAHHQGMLLASLTNFLAENYIQKLMCKNLKLSSALTIYNENVPRVAFGLKNNEKRKNIPLQKEDYYKINTKIEQYFQTGVLSDTQYSALVANSSVEISAKLSGTNGLNSLDFLSSFFRHSIPIRRV